MLRHARNRALLGDGPQTLIGKDGVASPFVTLLPAPTAARATLVDAVTSVSYSHTCGVEGLARTCVHAWTRRMRSRMRVARLYVGRDSYGVNVVWCARCPWFS